MRTTFIRSVLVIASTAMWACGSGGSGATGLHLNGDVAPASGDVAPVSGNPAPVSGNAAPVSGNPAPVKTEGTGASGSGTFQCSGSWSCEIPNQPKQFRTVKLKPGAAGTCLIDGLAMTADGDLLDAQGKSVGQWINYVTSIVVLESDGTQLVSRECTRLP